MRSSKRNGYLVNSTEGTLADACKKLDKEEKNKVNGRSY